ncbi:RagB/SusD family nutrient uptake outer membrane protein [Olivibacter sp. XZL3]|uniref:RagB/SusD family nutrient uptake outer membrane protein n=1 Tax=Olivibacter sp. XZL3 TaxID=1735116 RepID=UPI0010647FFA|nr:RagB/SusD family nutrient uptake outer membrane protein [Olivibacter sp. XZL3]
MKHRKSLIYAFILFLTTWLSGCKDVFETGPSTAISDELMFNTVDGAQTAMNGVYNYMRLRNTDIEYGTVIQFNNGFDAASNDLIVRNSMGQMQVYYAHNTAETRADATLTREVWSYFYTIINNVNVIINNIDGAVGNETQKTAIKGQALAVRGWAYFYLIRFYQQTYVLAKDRPGVPYYDQGGTIEGKPRESVSFIYDRIVDDLMAAIDLLASYNRTYKSQINQTVAQGILAEVYLTMEDWTNAAAMASVAKASYPLMTEEEYQSGFNDWDLDEWMWGVHQTPEQNLGNGSPFTLWANQSRGDRWTFDFMYVNDRFKDLFSAEDVRNQFWFREDHGFWTSDKFRDAADFYGDIILMRASEMFLIEAEALGRQGRENEAKEVLWQLQDQRHAARSTASGSALIDDILVERRKELYGEGFAWFDLIRNQRPVHREGDHPLKPEIPARSWQFILQIPTNEFNSNTSLTPADQNPYDGIFQP